MSKLNRNWDLQHSEFKGHGTVKRYAHEDARNNLASVKPHTLIAMLRRNESGVQVATELKRRHNRGRFLPLTSSDWKLIKTLTK